MPAPLHTVPPWAGVGFEQVRVLLRIPTPHVAEQGYNNQLVNSTYGKKALSWLFSPRNPTTATTLRQCGKTLVRDSMFSPLKNRRSTPASILDCSSETCIFFSSSVQVLFHKSVTAQYLQSFFWHRFYCKNVEHVRNLCRTKRP